MLARTYWQDCIEKAWRRRNVVWMMGVRRAGKTTLAESLAEVEVLDCELPSVRRQLDDPEEFLASRRGRRIVLDEIHRLANPSELLKIAADHYKDVRVLATGSSTLGASARFRDTLTGRKEEVWLTPMTTRDLVDFAQPDLRHRLLRGGLPPFFLAPDLPDRDFQSWVDDFWAKDVLELFRLERRASFMRFFELLMSQSAGLFEATRFSGPCEVSRPTITNYLAVLEATFVVHVIRPYATRRAREIVSAPKVYGFDTGFVCHHRGWHTLRNDDLGPLWEHFVLNELGARLQTRRIRYWRSKQGAEIDFVLVARGGKPIAIECKWKAEGFEPDGLRSFRALHPGGANFAVASNVDRPSSRRYDDLTVRFVGLSHLPEELAAHLKGPLAG